MIRINLLADRKAKDRYLVQQQLVLGLVAFVATLVLCGFVSLDLNGKKTDYANRITEVNQKITDQNQVILRVQDFEKSQKRLEEILKAISDLEKIQIGPTPYLDMLNVLLPDDLWLRQIEETESSITLKGLAFSNPGISELAERMKNSSFFDEVDIKESQQKMVEGEKVNDFTIVSKLKPLDLKTLQEQGLPPPPPTEEKGPAGEEMIPETGAADVGLGSVEEAVPETGEGQVSPEPVEEVTPPPAAATDQNVPTPGTAGEAVAPAGAGKEGKK